MIEDVIVCLSRCESCQFAYHFDPPEPHSWMSPEDAEFHGHPWPLPPEVEAKHQCGCHCATPPERAAELAAENRALREQMNAARHALRPAKENP